MNAHIGNSQRRRRPAIVSAAHALMKEILGRSCECALRVDMSAAAILPGAAMHGSISKKPATRSCGRSNLGMTGHGATSTRFSSDTTLGVQHGEGIMRVLLLQQLRYGSYPAESSGVNPRLRELPENGDSPYKKRRTCANLGIDSGVVCRGTKRPKWLWFQPRCSRLIFPAWVKGSRRLSWPGRRWFILTFATGISPLE